MQNNIPYYAVAEPYELFYRNAATKYPVDAHTHNTAEIYLTLTDLPDVLLNDTVSSVKKGSLILIPPFCIHQLYHEKDIVYERFILNLNTDWLENVLYSEQELTGYLRPSAEPLILPLNDFELTALTEAMFSLLPKISEKSIKNTAEFFAMLAILDSAVEVSKAGNPSPLPYVSVTKSQKTVNDIIAYINGHLEENLSLAEISAHFYLNKDYLSRLFMKHAHTSIGRYITIRRIAKAQEYLRSGLTVAQVSERMGFSSYAYFFKVFQKMTGISPSKYRNSLS